MAKAFTISLNEDQSTWLDMLLLDFLNFELDKMTPSSGAKTFMAAVTGQPEGTRALLATAALGAEVGNGGFKQFFWNTSGAEEGLHKAARSGLSVIGALKHLSVFDAAYQLAAPHLGRFRELAKLDLNLDLYHSKYTVELQAAGTENKLWALDEEFFAIRPTLAQARLIFAANNPHLCRVTAQATENPQAQAA